MPDLSSLFLLDVVLKRIPREGVEPAAIPAHQTQQSAGVDLAAAICKPVTIWPDARFMCPTGLALQPTGARIPVVGLLFPRSSLGKKHGLMLLNQVGVIDADYQGEIVLMLHNFTNVPATIQPGERLAQLVFVPHLFASFRTVDEFETATERGAGGFGSTGSGS